MPSRVAGAKSIRAKTRLINVPIFDASDAASAMRPIPYNKTSKAESAPKLRCREIEAADVAGVVDLLAEGFATRRRDYWVRALARMSDRQTPQAFPRYGYILESAGAPVGALLLIYASIVEQGREVVRCNVSSWHVRPEFRAFAHILVSRGLKHPQVTYFNISPAPNTIPILKAQGYTKYCDGLLLTAPWLSPRLSAASVEEAAACTPMDLPSYEETLLRRHADYGCISLRCVSDEGIFPFIFAPCRAGKKGAWAPYARLIYCRSLAEFARFARPLGSFLARRGFPIVVLDSNGPISELQGIYFRNRPKYFKGPHKPRLGDLAYSELALFDPIVGRLSARRGDAFNRIETH